MRDKIISIIMLSVCVGYWAGYSMSRNVVHRAEFDLGQGIFALITLFLVYLIFKTSRSLLRKDGSR